MSSSNWQTHRRWLPLAAAFALVIAFVCLNSGACDGFFQDDEFDTLGWAPFVSAREYAVGLLTPLFSTTNFRPVGHAYFTIMSHLVGSDFPPFMTPVLLTHLLNCVLLYALLRKLKVQVWQALAGAAFFGFSAAAMDAYWKPMYVYDLFCAAFSLASILLFTMRRWVLSFIAFWLAYKAKELAVMLPLALLAYEYLLGQRRYVVLIPFFLASLSFGLQGILLNPNKDNGYTFRFTFDALRITVPYYAHRLLNFRGSTLLLLPLVLIRDRRVWFAILSVGCFLFTLLFLPGRLFEAYFYLPLACSAIAIAAALDHVRPRWAWGLFAVWMIFNTIQLRRAQDKKLDQDDTVYSYVAPIQDWAAQHPDIRTLIFDAPPTGFHDWGVAGMWNIAHCTIGLQALYRDTAEARAALAKEPVAVAMWNAQSRKVGIQLHTPQ